FPKVTVSGTHTALMAAALSSGTTVIDNAAREPEIADVAACLNKMGAKISDAGTARIVIEGVSKLNGARHSVLPDRIETGTYAMAVAMTGGDVTLEGAQPELLQSALDVLAQAGVEIAATNTGLRVARNGAGIAPVEVVTDPFPGFPTDLQAQLMALMTRAKGASHITETIFENRFMHVQELVRLGARIHLNGDTATIEGVERLKGAPVMATDLRASVSLVIAGLAAEGETMVNRVYHLDRGFERLEDKLSACGADIQRISGSSFFRTIGDRGRADEPLTTLSRRHAGEDKKSHAAAAFSYRRPASCAELRSVGTDVDLRLFATAQAGRRAVLRAQYRCAAWGERTRL